MAGVRTDIGRRSVMSLEVSKVNGKGTGTSVDPQTEELQKEYMVLK
jgi:hypothetical protein